MCGCTVAEQQWQQQDDCHRPASLSAPRAQVLAPSTPASARAAPALSSESTERQQTRLQSTALRAQML